MTDQSLILHPRLRFYLRTVFRQRYCRPDKKGALRRGFHKNDNRTGRFGEKNKNRTTHKRTAGKSGYHQDDHRTWDSPDKAEIRLNYRKWLTSTKVFDILTLNIKCSNKKWKRRSPSDEKTGTGLYFRFCAYH